ncbi:TetR/AcrR family transcriptional regulator [Rhizobium sp. L1K21]|uniref:TetR/AcrR family transcriptional regulator n=1 Tax=Rhizobium sp. L1K21 TaxID=2954933 RepID=UPI002092450D|nr:TetR/AcrR family transcriptional regulator [Rhizobium sp. L1K21]MCO6184934.1 TetR/AcrR family transcriptional regulator [Rhizobium sp. L1K21]
MMNDQETLENCSNRRKAAGENPAKRDQILDGAKRVFMEKGFDGASINDITRAAGVSKGTIYVYFESKHDLFGALVERERRRISENVRTVLDDAFPIRETLFNFGTLIAAHLSSPSNVRGMRMALGVVDTMPDTAHCFLREGLGSGPQILKAYLDRQVAAGLLQIDDTMLAARQFSDLCVSGLFKPALFGEMRKSPPRPIIEGVVKSAIEMFMARYGK